jgi:putative tryptophan/tyrosine transport system substrate-binding protein
VAPTASRVGWLDVPGIERPEVVGVMQQKEDDSARSLGLTIRRVTVREPNDIVEAFATLDQQGVRAVIVPNTSLLNPHSARIAGLAMKYRLPSFGSPIFARTGGLLAYGPDGADMYRRAAGYVDRVFKGAQPADLPMEGPAKFELVINLKTAKALGLTIPQSLLVRADEVIQ